MNLQTVLCLSFSRVSLEIDVNWLFVIIKSYVKVNFKERNNNNNNNNNNNSPLKMMKIFLSFLFGHVERLLDKMAEVNFRIFDATDWEIDNYITRIVQYLKKKRQPSNEFDHLIEYNVITP